MMIVLIVFIWLIYIYYNTYLDDDFDYEPDYSHKIGGELELLKVTYSSEQSSIDFINHHQNDKNDAFKYAFNELVLHFNIIEPGTHEYNTVGSAKHLYVAYAKDMVEIKNIFYYLDNNIYTHVLIFTNEQTYILNILDNINKFSISSVPLEYIILCVYEYNIMILPVIYHLKTKNIIFTYKIKTQIDNLFNIAQLNNQELTPLDKTCSNLKSELNHYKEPIYLYNTCKIHSSNCPDFISCVTNRFPNILNFKRIKSIPIQGINKGNLISTKYNDIVVFNYTHEYKNSNIPIDVYLFEQIDNLSIDIKIIQIDPEISNKYGTNKVAYHYITLIAMNRNTNKCVFTISTSFHYNMGYISFVQSVSNIEGLCKPMMNILINYLFYYTGISTIYLHCVIEPQNKGKSFMCYMKAIGSYFPLISARNAMFQITEGKLPDPKDLVMDTSGSNINEFWNNLKKSFSGIGEKNNPTDIFMYFSSLQIRTPYDRNKIPLDESIVGGIYQDKYIKFILE